MDKISNPFSPKKTDPATACAESLVEEFIHSYREGRTALQVKEIMVRLFERAYRQGQTDKLQLKLEQQK